MEIAYSEEEANAIQQEPVKAEAEEMERLVAHNEAWRKHLGSIHFVKQYIYRDDNPKWDSSLRRGQKYQLKISKLCGWLLRRAVCLLRLTRRAIKV